MEIDYKKVSDFDCPLCDWSLHVTTKIWEEMPEDSHTEILLYIQSQLDNHARTTHKVNNVNSLSQLTLNDNVEKTIKAAEESPYFKQPEME
jgi:hypothetical protein